MKLQQKVYHDKHGKGEIVRKQKPYFWVKYDKYEKPLRHEQKQVGSSVESKLKSRLKPISKREQKWKIINVDPNWKSNNDITYLGKL